MHTHSSISFVREAFFHPVNLGFLLSVGIFALFFSGVQGLPVVLLTAGIGLELLYLGTIPNKGWFQRHIIRSQEGRNDRDSSEAACFERLCMERQKQFLALRRLTTTVRENFRLMPASSRPLTQQLAGRLDELQSKYLRHLLILDRYEEYLADASAESITLEIRTLKKAMETIRSGKVLEIKKQRLHILNKRLDRYKAGKEKIEVCRSQLETMEDAVRYVYEKSITMSHPEEVGGHLDRLIDELEETSAIIQDIEDELPPTYTILNQYELNEESGAENESAAGNVAGGNVGSDRDRYGQPA
ncbi:hypothetical protein [Natronogracilivirga saccharolytica]|uniref:Uncharacterized protein n=1 Tax=Natronogracilivirga saccharolytica TaxID=2812953 RepID=A0A8J7RFU5_9BACT|nr:hypothetical protein [Natronogracilivirga saccharolytica]MBP3191140.1 hypothetical protein [Natronogracilivirga saccharolytica]